MNAKDRAAVLAIRSKLEDAQNAINELGGRLRDLADAEQEKFDNMSEGLQQGDTGQAIEAAASALSSAADEAENGDVEAAINAIDEVEL